MPIYYVQSETGKFIMSAPIETLQRVFKLQIEAIQRIEHETSQGGTCRLFFDPPACGYWLQISIRRLSIDIPDTSSSIRRQAG